MTSFKHEDALKFWFNYKDPLVYRIIVLMESLENWTIDDNDDINQALQKFGHALENQKEGVISKEEELIKLIVSLKLSRTLYVLQSLEGIKPGLASNLLSYAEKQSQSFDQENNLASVFLKRNLVFERMRLFKRIFSKDRLALVQQALEDENIE